MSRGTGQITVRVAGNYEASKMIMELDAISREYFFQAMNEIGKIGEQEMLKKIRETDSSYERSGLKRVMGFITPGRTRSGKMYKSVGSRPRGRGKLFQTEVGYIRGEYQEYFKFQEFGFYNIWQYFGQNVGGKSEGPNTPPGGFIMRRRKNPKSHYVKGIFALKSAREKMEESIPVIMGRLDKRINRHLNRLAKPGKG
jgi:hypothetical protein